jgi:hypothetical protein
VTREARTREVGTREYNRVRGRSISRKHRTKTQEAAVGYTLHYSFQRAHFLQDPTPLARTPDFVWITFKVRERGVWRTAQSLHVCSSDLSEVKRMAVKYARKRGEEQIRVYDTDLNILTPQMCF